MKLHYFQNLYRKIWTMNNQEIFEQNEGRSYRYYILLWGYLKSICYTDRQIGQ